MTSTTTTRDALGWRLARHDDAVRTAGWLSLDSLRPAAELNAANEVTSLFIYGGDGPGESRTFERGGAPLDFERDTLTGAIPERTMNTRRTPMHRRSLVFVAVASGLGSAAIAARPGEGGPLTKVQKWIRRDFESFIGAIPGADGGEAHVVTPDEELDLCND